MPKIKIDKILAEEMIENKKDESKPYNKLTIFAGGEVYYSFDQKFKELIGQEVDAFITETEYKGNKQQRLDLTSSTKSFERKRWGMSTEESDKVTKLALINAAIKFYGEGQAKSSTDILELAKELYHAVKEAW